MSAFLDAVAATAGRPYVFGGELPFDCSALVAWAIAEVLP